MFLAANIGTLLQSGDLATDILPRNHTVIPKEINRLEQWPVHAHGQLCPWPDALFFLFQIGLCVVQT